MKRVCQVSFFCLSLGSLLAVLAGCQFDSPTAKVDAEVPVAWTVTKPSVNLGHDTLEAEDGDTYHNSIYAVVLNRQNESIRLIYENSLPEGIDVRVGEQYVFQDLESASYSEHWNGYWLTTVQLNPARTD